MALKSLWLRVRKWAAHDNPTGYGSGLLFQIFLVQWEWKGGLRRRHVAARCCQRRSDSHVGDGATRSFLIDECLRVSFAFAALLLRTDEGWPLISSSRERHGRLSWSLRARIKVEHIPGPQAYVAATRNTNIKEWLGLGTTLDATAALVTHTLVKRSTGGEGARHRQHEGVLRQCHFPGQGGGDGKLCALERSEHFLSILYM